MPQPFKRTIEKLVTPKAPGPSPNFSVFHLLLAIELIAQEDVGRNKLAQRLSLGEGATRTLVERLRQAGLVHVSKAGCVLSRKGMDLYEEYQSTFKKGHLRESELSLGRHSFIILIRNVGANVKSGVEQRDAAVMTGAKGAVTMVFVNGQLALPSVSRDVAKDFPKAASEIVRMLRPEENDAVVVASADTREKAEYSALAAAWTLLKDC